MNAVAEEHEAVMAEQEAAAAEQEPAGIDVDLDESSDFSMEWEVETEPAPMADPDPVYEEPYYGYEKPRRAVSRSINKHIFTWLCSFYLGIFGVDRFCRGQIVLGLLKLLTFGGFGFWYMADWIIAVMRSYAGEYQYMDNVLFDRFGNYTY